MTVDVSSQWKFALLLFVGVGLLLISLSVLSTEYSQMASQFLSDPNAIVPACNPGVTSGCVIWPFIDLAAAVVGLVLILVGAIGLLERLFPRGDV
jgi:flagellar biosynthesis protein FliR